jgi:hypothetical protein
LFVSGEVVSVKKGNVAFPRITPHLEADPDHFRPMSEGAHQDQSRDLNKTSATAKNPLKA